MQILSKKIFRGDEVRRKQSDTLVPLCWFGEDENVLLLCSKAL